MRTRRDFLKLSGLTVASGVFTTLCSAKTPGCQRPNVILVLTDDQGHGDLACHGNPILKTPVQDKLFAESVRLTDFHVSPCCTPTRASLMTGHDAVRTGAWGTTWGRSLLRKDERTMADVFAANGYKTGMFGKWHLGDNYPFRPQDRGFQEVLCHRGGGVGQTPDYWGNDYFDDTYYHNGKPQQYTGYCTDVWFDHALQFIEQNKNRPFFCYLPTNAPHGPYLVAEKYKEPYRDNPTVPNAAFYGMIANIDENMKKLLSRLKEWDIEDNTILIFMTDNGTAAGYKDGRGYNSGMRGTKGSYYEGGHRVPCFIRWPKKGLKDGRNIDEMTAHIDILPTLIELCGLDIPQGMKFDGVSFASLLTGTENQLDERSIILQYSQTSTPPRKWESTVMHKKWRLVNGSELYDIEVDPGQKTDIADKYPEIVKRLRNDYERWWAGVAEQFNKTCHIIVGSNHENPATLTAHDWHTMTPWNQTHIRAGSRVSGYWAVQVERDGTYEIALRRWPQELDKPITSAIPDGVAVPAKTARLEIGTMDMRQEITEGGCSVIFRLNLKAQKTRLQTWFMDDKGNELCGAYYVYVKRV